MFRFFMNLFKPTPKPTPEEALWDAVERLNRAWGSYTLSGGKLRPWIDWPNREMVLALPAFTKAEAPYSKQQKVA